MKVTVTSISQDEARRQRAPTLVTTRVTAVTAQRMMRAHLIVGLDR